MSDFEAWGKLANADKRTETHVVHHCAPAGSPQ